MIAFKPIDLSDKETVQKYTLCSPRRNCDLSFVNLYSWRFLYQTEIAEMDGFLLFRFYADGQLAYMMPVGEGSDIRPVIEALMEDAKVKGLFSVCWVCVPICVQSWKMLSRIGLILYPTGIMLITFICVPTCLH